ncbi:hypothetical protein HAX54_013289 [Datura stramonium]|uniref:Uncharacterized protein n=1 Tax=Datura stramonium TaxID=4076 RepID=A0ABS8TN03_DATST|nr:hypothetical protein [Datura stramonium]
MAPPPPTNVDEEAVGWEVEEEISKKMFASIILNSEGLKEVDWMHKQEGEEQGRTGGRPAKRRCKNARRRPM